MQHIVEILLTVAASFAVGVFVGSRNHSKIENVANVAEEVKKDVTGK